MWSQDETNILIENYIKYTMPELKKLFPTKTTGAINGKIRRLKLSKYKKWSKQEDNIIKQYYPILTLEKISRTLIKNRGIMNIGARANYLGVRKNPPHKRWTSREDDILIIYYKTLNKNILKKLNRSRDGISGRLKLLKKKKLLL